MRSARGEVRISGVVIDLLIENIKGLLKHYKFNHRIYKFVILGKDLIYWLTRNTAYNRTDNAKKFCEALLTRRILVNAVDGKEMSFTTEKDGIYFISDVPRIDISIAPLDELMDDVLYYMYEEIERHKKVVHGISNDCFTGEALVEWFLERTNVPNRDTTILIGQMLLNRNIIHHIGDTTDFEINDFYHLATRSRILIGEKLFLKDRYIFHRYWKPESKVHNGVILHLHDLGSASSVNSEEHEYLSRAGFIVCAIEQRGHGRSENTRSFNICDFVDDVSSLIEDIEKKFEGYPIFLYGIGFGGLIALLQARQKLCTPSVVGVIAASPFLNVTMELEDLEQSVSLLCDDNHLCNAGILETLTQTSKEVFKQPNISQSILLLEDESLRKSELHNTSYLKSFLKKVDSEEKQLINTHKRKNRLDIISQWCLETSLLHF